MKKAKNLVKVVSDEKGFSAVLDIITSHRSRVLKSEDGMWLTFGV